MINASRDGEWTASSSRCGCSVARPPCYAPRLACRTTPTKPLTLPPAAVPAPSPPPGSPWFRVKKMPREQYRELLERQDAERAEAADQALSDSGSEAKKSVKDRIDEAW